MFRTDNFEEAYEHHKKMGCICYGGKDMGIYYRRPRRVLVRSPDRRKQ